MFYSNIPYPVEEDISMLMTVPELADYLCIGRNRAYNLLRDGTIKGFKIGCTWRVSRAVVNQYILEHSGF
ncbi:helix-turn-helix domain-containing protein [Lachnospiraceae bacterium 48-42]|jgi:DNA binding domain, excisionase family|nr:helix-turn-helix domain-containing protein [Dorea sp.]